MNPTHSSGPPLHAKYPGVFDQTGVYFHPNRARFGLCLIIFRKRRVLHARIGKGVKSEKMSSFDKSDKGGEIFHSDGIELQLSQQRPVENFCSVENLNPYKLYESVKVRENDLT